MGARYLRFVCAPLTVHNLSDYRTADFYAPFTIPRNFFERAKIYRACRISRTEKNSVSSRLMYRVAPNDMHDFELIAQGAEARVYKGVYLGRPTLVKERFQKKYRHADLDSRITKDRTKAECRAIVRAKAAGVATPALYLVNFDRRCIYMEYVENATVLKDFIEKNISGKSDVDRLIKTVTQGLGTLVARLHSRNIIHGDLTTSNVLLKDVPDDVDVDDDEAAKRFVMIDFGLARVDSTAEDKAVDLYVLERSLLSAHSEIPSLFPEIFDAYKKRYANQSQCKEVIAKYREVQARGRKRLMIG